MKTSKIVFFALTLLLASCEKNSVNPNTGTLEVTNSIDHGNFVLYKSLPSARGNDTIENTFFIKGETKSYTLTPGEYGMRLSVTPARTYYTEATISKDTNINITFERFFGILELHNELYPGDIVITTDVTGVQDEIIIGPIFMGLSDTKIFTLEETSYMVLLDSLGRISSQRVKIFRDSTVVQILKIHY